MCKSIDLKSAVIGGLVVALVICAVGAVRFAQTDTYGRFEIATNPDHGFVLDTATGQVWTLQTGITSEFGIINAPPHAALEFYDPKTYDSHAVAEPNWP
jgi:hypothetical protein